MVWDQLGRDAEHQNARLVSISIDPEFDTSSRLREYADRIGASPSDTHAAHARRTGDMEVC